MSGSYPCTVKQNVAFLYPQIHLILCRPPLLAVERQNCEKSRKEIRFCFNNYLQILLKAPEITNNEAIN